MSYDPRSDYLTYLRRIANITDFKSRSRRNECFVFFAVMTIAHLLAEILISFFVSSASPSYLFYLETSLWLFFFPVFVRRLHDLDRSGWFALILPVMICLKVYAQILFDRDQLSSPLNRPPLGILDVVLAVLFWAVILLPGTNGDNRFGPDPRIGSV